MIRSSDADAPDLVYFTCSGRLSDICIKGILSSVKRSCNLARLIVGSVLARVKEVREAAAIALTQVTRLGNIATFEVNQRPFAKGEISKLCSRYLLRSRKWDFYLGTC